MSNTVNTNTLLEKFKQMNRDMCKGGAAYNSYSGEADPEETYKLKDIELDADEILLFNGNVAAEDSVYKMTQLISYNELTDTVRNIFKSIFADLIGVALEKVGGKWMFNLYFSFMTDDQFKTVQEENTAELVRAVSSTFNPTDNKGGSVAETLMALNNTQNMANSDVCKYASINKDAKSYLSNYLFYAPENKKKKWVKGENYRISNVPQRGYNGQVYHNIIAEVRLDANKFAEVLFSDKDNRSKFTFDFKDLGTNNINNNKLIEVYRFSKKAEAKAESKYNADIRHD